MKKQWEFEVVIGKIESLKLHYLCFPRASIIEMNEASEKNLFKQRVWIHIGESISWQGAFVGLGNGDGYITISQARMKKFGLQLGDLCKVKLEKDESEFGMPVPEELIAVFSVEPLYVKHFEQLTKGMQRYILYYIDQVKSTEKREERALLLMNNLVKHQDKKITFRLLLGKD
ncbi:MAG: YdeI/OmpD-associated family protein [Bacteroidetes bacterium]|nr:YdeI/OmpD-associated family protein [Bacteroidota bacterium]